MTKTYTTNQVIRAFAYEMHSRGRDSWYAHDYGIQRAVFAVQQQYPEQLSAFEFVQALVVHERTPVSSDINTGFTTLQLKGILTGQNGRIIISTPERLRKPTGELEQIAVCICDKLEGLLNIKP